MPESLFLKKTLLNRDSNAFACEFWNIFKNTSFYRTPSTVAASDYTKARRK